MIILGIESSCDETSIAVLKDGAIQQVAPPEEILEHPATEFVAELFKGGAVHA